MNEPLTCFAALEEAIRRAGSQVALAAQCDCAQPTVWKWVNFSKRVSAPYVLKVEAATGVSRHDLRPDLYPRESAPPAPAAQDAA